MEITMYIANR